MREVDGLRVADWLVEENAHRARTRKWIIPRKVVGAESPSIEGFIDKVSAVAGEELTLYVNTVAASFRAYVYRVGYYGGYGGRLIAQSPELRGTQQPTPHFTAGVNLVECRWSPSWRVQVGDHWPPGSYLIRLEGAPDQQQYVPFVVRDDASEATYLVQSSVTTWQAYNPYGGYSLYGGPGQNSLANRSRVVSFDRPYGHDRTALDARGSGDFLGNELPFIFLAERLGLDLTYWTDVDLHEQPALLAKHRCLISLGHDEYWSTPMRDAVEAGIEKGLNVAFLGANACYRQIRLEASPTGGNRRVICYKDAAADPIAKADPALATGSSWATDLVSRPESSLTGVMYQAYGANAPLVVANAASWVFAGTGLKDGSRLSSGGKQDLVGSEFDGYEPGLHQPPGHEVEILAHSPVQGVTGSGYSDMAYYSVPGGGGVFATGTASWVTSLWDAPPATVNRLGLGVGKAAAPLASITVNVLRVFGAGPADERHPSATNWRHFYSPGAKFGPSVDVVPTR